MNQTNQNQNSNGRQFTEVSGGGQGIEFKPHATELNGFHFDPNSPNNILEGYYKSLNEGIPTQFGTMSTASVQKVNPDGTLGEVYSVILDTFLKDKMQSIPLNTYVRLEYKGKTLKKGTPLMGNGQPQMWSKTNSFHTWFVGADYNAIPMNQLVSKMAPTTNHVNSSNAPGASLNQNPFGNTQQPQNPPFNQAPNFQQQPVFNTQNTGAQAPFGNPQQPFVQQPPAQSVQAPNFNKAVPQQQVPQQTYFPPTPQQQVQAPVQQQNFQQQPPSFGGQPIQGNPFGNNPKDDLPF